VRPTFAGHPLANALFGCTVLIWVVIQARQGLYRRTDARPEDRYSLIVVGGAIAMGVLLAWLALTVKQATVEFNPLLFGLGLCLMWIGVAVRWWSFRTLGHYFTFSVMTSSDQQVITSGPYRVLRHPSYAGILLVLMGIGVCFGNWLSVAALLIFPFLGLLYRISVEERALSAALGAAYADYARGRKRLIPFIW
jgi:protein-S-isoprenylcysteine O-methyltransferase Ste14